MKRPVAALLLWKDASRTAAYDVPGQIRLLSLTDLHARGRQVHGDLVEGQTYQVQVADEHGSVGTFRVRILTGAEQAQIDTAVRHAEAHLDAASLALLVADLERRGAWSAAMQVLSDTAARHSEMKATVTTLQSEVESDLATVRKEAAHAP